MTVSPTACWEGVLQHVNMCRQSSVTAHNEGERQSYIDVINTTMYYQKYSHNHMTGWHSHLQHTLLHVLQHIMREKGRVILMWSILLYTIWKIPTTTWLVDTATFNTMGPVGTLSNPIRLRPSPDRMLPLDLMLYTKAIHLPIFLPLLVLLGGERSLGWTPGLGGQVSTPDTTIQSWDIIRTFLIWSTCSWIPNSGVTRLP